MKTIIAGGRELNTDQVEAWLDWLVPQLGWTITEVVSGAAAGADTAGERWAAKHGIPVRQFPADWSRHGRAAGPLRNRQMACYAQALIAFDTGGPGTRNMLQEAGIHGLQVYRFEVPACRPS